MIKNKAQAILGYALLFALVAAVVIAMSVFLKRKIQGNYKKSADTLGFEEQYEPFGGTVEISN